ncbi:MAG: hypothetical protein HUU21_12660 [Polyangiaceae bacterium]|nr:hypothetical protein [Polyangiaceae bacterium]
MGPQGPPGVSGGPTTFVRFTRATISSNDTIAAKDALCVAEYGAGFRTASWLDLTALYKSEVYSNHRFTISNATISTAVYMDTSSSGYSFITNAGVIQTVQVACVRNTAPLQFTRATVASNADVITKDGLCEAEFGPAFNTASWLDVTALFQAVVYSNHRFTIANTTISTAVYMDTSSSGYSFITNAGVIQTVQVVCAMR